MGKETFPKSPVQRTDGPEMQGRGAGKDQRLFNHCEVRRTAFPGRLFSEEIVDPSTKSKKKQSAIICQALNLMSSYTTFFKSIIAL